MSTIVRDATAKTDLFPLAQVEAALRQGIEGAMALRAFFTGSTGPGGPSAGSEIVSFSLVELLCTIDEIVGFEVPQKVVRAGGYPSLEAAVEHLLPGVERCWSKRKGGKR